MKRLPALFFALSLGFAPVSALAEDGVSVSASGTVQFGLLSVEGLKIGTTLKIDTAFGAEHGLAVPAPFSFFVPLADEVLELADPAPKPGDAFIKVAFATENRDLIENVQFIPATVAMGASGERVQALAQLLANQAWAGTVAGKGENARDLVREIKVGPYAGVEVLGRYMEDGLGLMYARIVGILNPDGPDCVVTIANVVAARQEVPTADDFARTRSGAAVDGFRFLPPGS